MEDRIIETEYSEIMSKSFIDYAMSVIVARALPDVRDGLKPVQRRTLYDMYEQGMRYDRPHRKSAKIVGDTMGKYHPHGDSSIYEALVVMTQDFKKTAPLVDGHGNFGNIEGDGAAASRYTEARLSKITQDAYLADMDKDIVDFIPNYDETEKEPVVLPCKIPNLLVNGAEGIAVGMATSIPQHNVAEVIDAMKAYMKDETVTTADLMRYLPGPDFPTGGVVINKDDLPAIYETGVGKIKIRGKVDIEKGKNGKTNIVISEIPYTMIGSGIAKFLKDVGDLYYNNVAPEISDITNQSNMDGIRIVIELKKDSDPENFINLLYKKTRLEDTFGVNMLAIADGRPETLGLKEIIAHSVKFQFELAQRKYTNLLEKERNKKEIQEGLIKACNVIDLIIEILRGSKDRQMAKDCLVNGNTTGISFKHKESKIMAQQLCFTENQANAILEMRLYKLIGLEIDALIKEHDETVANIYRYEDILERRDSMAQVIMNELDVIKKEYKRDRRTVIENAAEAVYEERKPEEMDVVFLMDKFGYAKTIELSAYEKNKEAADSESKFILVTKNTGKICLFTNKGTLYTVKTSDLPFGRFRDKGVPIDNVSGYSSSKEEILLITSQSEINLNRLIFVTKFGMAKIVSGGEFDVARKTVLACTLNDDDELVSVALYKEQKNIVLKTKEGCFLRFQIEEIPEKKKAAIGVRAIKLTGKDYIDEVFYTRNTDEQYLDYHGKKLELNKIKLGKRDTKGVKVRV